MLQDLVEGTGFGRRPGFSQRLWHFGRRMWCWLRSGCVTLSSAPFVYKRFPEV